MEAEAPLRRQVHDAKLENEELSRQGLTLVNFSAQLKRFLWDRGCI